MPPEPEEMDKLTIISGCLFLAADIFAIASLANPDWINTGESAGEGGRRRDPPAACGRWPGEGSGSARGGSGAGGVRIPGRWWGRREAPRAGQPGGLLAAGPKSDWAGSRGCSPRGGG